MTSVESLESKIRDVSDMSWNYYGNLFTQNVVQVVKETGSASELNTHYYSLSDDNVATRLGGVSFSKSITGEASMSFNITDESGASVPLLDLTATGATISGKLDVLGDGINFDSPELAVADESITLASGALVLADIDQGGLVLGTPESGTRTFLYSLDNDYWSTNAGVNVESGYGFTVAGSEVVLDETGLAVGGDVSLTSTSLAIGSGADIVTLDQTGLVIGENISLNASGLVAGDVSLDSDGLVIGGEIELSVANGLTIGNAASPSTVLDDTSLQLGASVLLNQEGVFFSGSTASIFMGPTNQWKISYDDGSENLKFQFYDTGTAEYVTKMELKSTD